MDLAARSSTYRAGSTAAGSSAWPRRPASTSSISACRSCVAVRTDPDPELNFKQDVSIAAPPDGAIRGAATQGTSMSSTRTDAHSRLPRIARRSPTCSAPSINQPSATSPSALPFSPATSIRLPQRARSRSTSRASRQPSQPDPNTAMTASLWGVSSIGQRNTYLDRRTWSDDDEARISQDQGFSG